MGITMNEVNQKVANLTNTTATTPISLRELNEKVDNAIATGKDWAIVNLSGGQWNDRYSKFYNFDPKYNSYQYAIIRMNYELEDSREGGTASLNMGNVSFVQRARSQASLTISKQTSRFFVESGQMDLKRCEFNVLFYK